jgi:flagellar basal-body rod protein FlgF
MRQPSEIPWHAGCDIAAWMNYGLQISASGLMTSLYRQDVWSNNLANTSTTGFKPDIPMAMSRDAATVEDNVGFLPSNRLLEKLGAGVLMAPNRIQYAQGSLETTGDPMHCAIRGEGFFVVRDSADKNVDRVRLTRDGRFARNAKGVLVTAASGQMVLDTQGKSIEIPDSAPFTIQPTGSIIQNGQEIAKIDVIDVADKSGLSKLGEGLFLANLKSLQNRSSQRGDVIQGALESSGVDEITALMAVQAAARDVDGNAKMLQAHDRIVDRAINQFGRIV